MNTNKGIDELLIMGEIEEVFYEGHQAMLEGQNGRSHLGAAWGSMGFISIRVYSCSFVVRFHTNDRSFFL